MVAGSLRTETDPKQLIALLDHRVDLDLRDLRAGPPRALEVAVRRRSEPARDGRKAPSMVWICPDYGKRGTVFSAVEDDGRVAGSFYECPQGHCWDRPYD